MIKTKSVHSPKDVRRDGLRVLVARVRGRGLAKDAYDVWMPNLGPSEQLLSEIRGGEISWADFARRYKAELFEDASIDQRNRNIKNHGQKFTLRLLQELGRRSDVTLMCHCAEDAEHCHRYELKKIVGQSTIG